LLEAAVIKLKLPP